MITSYNYKLKYKTEVYKCTHTVTGFEDEGVKFGKASENKGVIKSYASEIQLIGRDAEWLKSIYITKGFNEQVRFEVYKDNFLKGETLEYYAFIDLSTVVINGNRCTFSLKQGGYITYLDNIMKKEFTLSNNSGFKNVAYNGNKYDFDIDIYSKPNMLTTFTGSTNNHVVSTVIKENNSNLEDIRIFSGAIEKKLTGAAYISDDNCFIKVLGQKYINRLKFNLNVDSIVFKNFGAVNLSGLRGSTGNVHYRYYLIAYNNVLNEWDVNDPSVIFSKRYDIYLNYSLLFTNSNDDINPSFITEVKGKATNANHNYIIDEDISQYLSGKDSDNIKFALLISPITLTFYRNGAAIFLVNDYGDLELNTNIEIKCIVKDFQLVPYKGINSWDVATVYKAITQTQRTQYQVSYDLRNIENLPYYLTSASEISGDTKLTTTLENLLQFIYIATGYRQIVNELNGVYYVSFEKYENSFKDVEIAKIDNASEVIIECEPDKIFTDVEVGWANKDTGIFKSSEYNTINKFRSAYTNIESNTLTMFCNYSASITDIETIIYNAGYNDKSNDAKDIYVIECYNDNGTIRNRQFAGSGTMKLCGNVGLTPRRILEAHKYELSDFFYHNNKLEFNTSNGLADIVINGIRENESITFVNQTMQPFILDFEGVVNQSVVKVDVNKYGYFTFLYNGSFIRGWIAEGSDSITVAPNGNVSKLRLIVKNNVIL